MVQRLSILSLPFAGIGCPPSAQPGTPSPTTEPEEEEEEEEEEEATPAEPTEHVVVTEIMYHPVLEEDYEDRDEFLELHNPGTAAVDLEGWSIEGIGYDVAAGVVLEPGGFLVVAKDPAALLAVSHYGLRTPQVVGPYEGQLDNGGETLSIVRPDGSVCDEVAYRDEFPWPIAADALGAGEGWLPPELLPLEDHRYAGVSLERVSLQIHGNEPANWVASDVDGPSPGAAFSGLTAEPKPVLEAHEVAAAPEGAPVQLDLTFSAFGSITDAGVATAGEDAIPDVGLAPVASDGEACLRGSGVAVPSVWGPDGAACGEHGPSTPGAVTA